MKQTELYMTAALFSFVAACIVGLATFTAQQWATGSILVGLLLGFFLLSFRWGIASEPRQRSTRTQELQLSRLAPAGTY